MYLSNKQQFLSTARFWTDCYAVPRAKEDSVRILALLY